MPLPVITVEEMRAWEDASWRAGRKESEVIATVGRLGAERALKMTHDNDRILVLAGKGNNGNDARAAVGHLLNRKVKLVEVNDPPAFDEIMHLLEKRPSLLIDGLFGIGLNRPLSPDWVRLIDRINAAELQVLSIDVPSGLNARNGQPEGAAIRASVTLTVGTVKRALLAQSARDYVGRLEVAPEIGLIPCTVDAQRSELLWSIENDFSEFQRRQRPASSHKGTFGHVAILAGSLGYHGAAVLAARGAQGAHPGLITVITQPDAYVPVASQLQSAMVHPWPAQIKGDDFCTALVVGPGLAARTLPDELRAEVKRLWRELRHPMIVDASALAWLEPGESGSDLVRIITPHPGEAGRMLGVSTSDVQADRISAVRKLSQNFGNSWVVLKGHQTLIGRAQGPVFVNSTGNPFLAQGGSGDVLAGFLGGLLAQPALQKDIDLTVRFGVWAHGAAADQLSARQGRWTVEELPSQLSVVGPKP
jgi:ADP-dependent NAD(P)H-hydrate dehydratase / NAD(P)H-hydrate epimerase